MPHVVGLVPLLQAQQRDSLSFLFPLLLFLAIFYFLLLRPQARQAKLRREMLSRLRAGDRIVTVGGIFATIIDIKEDALTLELAPNVRVKAERAAVQAVRSRRAEAQAEKAKTESKA